MMIYAFFCIFSHKNELCIQNKATQFNAVACSRLFMESGTEDVTSCTVPNAM